MTLLVKLSTRRSHSATWGVTPFRVLMTAVTFHASRPPGANRQERATLERDLTQLGSTRSLRSHGSALPTPRVSPGRGGGPGQGHHGHRKNKKPALARSRTHKSKMATGRSTSALPPISDSRLKSRNVRDVHEESPKNGPHGILRRHKLISDQ
jgi:hypothetical protein